MTAVSPVQNKPNPLICYPNQPSITNQQDRNIYTLVNAIFTQMRTLHNELCKAKQMGIKPDSLRDRYLFLQKSFPNAFYSLLSIRFKYTEELRNCFRQVGEAYQAVFGIENDCGFLEDVQLEREEKNNASSPAADFYSGNKLSMTTEEVRQMLGPSNNSDTISTHPQTTSFFTFQNMKAIGAISNIVK